MNLGYPINTEQDEIGLMVTLDGQQAYFSSNKINKANGWDIYFFDLYEAVQPEEVVLVKGNLEQLGATGDAAVVLKNSATGEESRLQVSSDDGSFAAVVQKEQADQVLLRVEAKNAAFSAAPVRIAAAEFSKPAPVVEITLEHRALAQGEAYPIPHILFETASDALDAQSELLLAEFAEFLAGAPRLRVQIQGHTDNVGDAGANLELSRRRAKRVAETLIAHGIPAGRLSHQGYGESRPVATNDTEEGRAKNRRTVFVVEAM